MAQLHLGHTQIFTTSNHGSPIWTIFVSQFDISFEGGQSVQKITPFYDNFDLHCLKK
jgi:hypothetical protein